MPDEDRYVTRLYRVAHIDADRGVHGPHQVQDQGRRHHRLPARQPAHHHRDRRQHRPHDAHPRGDRRRRRGRAALGREHQLHERDRARQQALRHPRPQEERRRAARPGLPAARARPAAAASAGPRVVADDRGNALIITATEPDYLRLLELIKRLDVKPSGDGEIHVLPLQHAGCKDLAQTLDQILGTGAGAFGAGARPGGATGTTRHDRRRGGVRGAAGSGIDEVFEGRLRITCDEATNSIVTTSSTRDYAQLHAVIDKLDRPRRQVFIEAVIMDVSIQRVGDYGISYHGGAPVNFGSAGQGIVLRRQQHPQLHQPGRAPLRPQQPLGARRRVAGARHPQLVEPLRHRALHPGPGRGASRARPGRRQQRARDAAHPRSRQPGRDHLHRPEHPPPAERRRRPRARSRARRAARWEAAWGCSPAAAASLRRARTSARRSRSSRTSTTPTRSASSCPRRSPTPAPPPARSAPSPSTSAPPRRSSWCAISRPWSSAA